MSTKSMWQALDEFTDRLEDETFTHIIVTAAADETRIDADPVDRYARLDFVLHLRRVIRALEDIEQNDSGTPTRSEARHIEACVR